MDCLQHPYADTEATIQCGRDLIMHIDHLHHEDSKEPSFIAEENVLALRGSTCLRCNWCLRAFYDKCAGLFTSADAAQAMLTHYMQNGAGVFSEDQQEDFQELAGEMFGTSGPWTSVDHSDLITRWQRANPKPAAAT